MQKLSIADLLVNEEYVQLLTVVGSLSGLFSDGRIPFIQYRVVENLFCRCFGAENLARTDTAFDAKLNHVGVGIKTFLLKSPMQKVAEFDKLAKALVSVKKSNEIIKRVVAWRNDRIDFANRLYGLKSPAYYHIVGREEAGLRIFNVPYSKIDLNAVCDVKQTKSSISFKDQHRTYSFNFAKSTLMQRFELPEDNVYVPVKILDDPFTILKNLFVDRKEEIIGLSLKKESVLLPLFSTRGRSEVVSVASKSGLNQWNAGGRPRHADEIYIPIPSQVHKDYPDFFPKRDCPFKLKLPNGEIIDAKVCQENGKALMSNPNKLLGKWLLRDVLQLKEGELLTMSILERLGFDSVVVSREMVAGEYLYDISVSLYDHYRQRGDEEHPSE